ncbi:hypothetical protein TNCV_2839141 [Trichonephila clavipes]|nr:hypothetical protein TNCV_2839141 [Trichonephila clavipes]
MVLLRYEKADFLFTILQKDIAGESLIAEKNGQVIITRPGSRGYLPLLEEETIVFGVRLWVHRIASVEDIRAAVGTTVTQRNVRN